MLYNDQKKRFSTFDKVFVQLEPINNAKPLDKPGFCIDSALVKGKVGPIWSGVSVNVPQWRDVSVPQELVKMTDHDPLLGQKVGRQLPVPTPYEMLGDREDFAKESEKSSDAARIVSFDVLRKRDKKIAGMAGQETAFRMELANGQKYYRFDWSSIKGATRLDKAGSVLP